MIQSGLLNETLHCFLVLLMVLIPCTIVCIGIRILTNIPSFIFRKILHVVAFGSFSFLILSTDNWKAAALTAVLIAVMIYPLLKALESQPWYPKLFVEKRPGEVRKSLLLLFFMFAALIAVCWGVFGKPLVAACAILMWGTGDAAAALVGIPYGAHKVQLRLADGKKSREGSIAMVITSFVAGMVVVAATQKAVTLHMVFAILISALIGALVELVSPGEYDTVSVPVAIALVLLTRM